MSNQATHHNVTETECISPLAKLAAKDAWHRERYPMHPSHYEQIIVDNLSELSPISQDVSSQLEQLNKLAFPADAPAEVAEQLREAAQTAARLSQLLAQLTRENPSQ